MPGGPIIMSVDVTNPAQYEELQTPEHRSHARAWCRSVRARRRRVQVLEGDWNPGRTVVMKFPSFEAAKAYHDSQEYRKARAAREGAATVRMVAVQGL